MEEKPLPERSWNRKPGRSFFVVAGFIIGGLVLVYGGMTLWYWWQLKQGKAVAPEKPAITFLESNSAFKVYSQSQVMTDSVDRKALETGPFLSWGGSNAKINIVEFMDFKCPFSRDEYETMLKLMGRYAGKVNIYVRNFPGESIYEGTRELSRLGYCGYAQGRFPKVYQYLFEHQSEILSPLTAESISTIASATGLNEKILKNCLADPKTDEKVAEDLSTGAGAGVRGTPTFFVNGQRVEGAIPFDAWQKFLDSRI